jgi:hypothetical protein
MTLEKDFFTNKRLEQLKYNPELLDTEQWGKYCCVPLDIPRYDYPEFVKWYFERAKTIYKLKSDVANSQYGMSNFDAVDVFLTSKIEDHIWTVNPQQDFLTLFPEILERIYQDFPVKSIGRLSFWSSHRGVRFHRDHTKFIDYPSSFRIMLYDTNPVQTLKLAECLPDHPEDEELIKIPIPRLAETNSVAWNNLRTKHGSFFIEPFRKIIIIIDRYELDVERYHDLMERSVKKYNEHLLISDRKLNDFIHI